MTVLAAVLLPVMIGVAALVLEFGGGLLTKVRLQRVADIAAFAGATAYNRTTTETSISAAAKMVGQLNGVAADAVTAQLTASPRGDGSQVVKVRVSVTNSLLLAKVIGFTPNLPVAATAYASVGGGVSACVIALSTSGAGVTLSGGTSLSAPTCGVSSNVSIVVPCGTTVTAKDASYAGAAPSAPCSGLKTPSGGVLTAKKKTVTDPLASDAGVIAATGRLATAAAVAVPAAPSAPTGNPIKFEWNPSETQKQAVVIGCTASSGPPYTVTCPAGGTYNISSITFGGGTSNKFVTSGTSANPTKFNFSEKLVVQGGASVEFPAGTFVFAKGLTVAGGSSAVFGAGSFSFGRSPDACGDGGYYSICHSGNALTFGGPSAFSINSGIHASGSAAITFGAGTSNSYDIGPSSNAFALTADGSAKVTFADASSGSGRFNANGSLNLKGGGTCTALPVSAQHDIKGYITTAGGVLFGTGIYTVTGHIAFGADSGGNVTCNGENYGVKGTGVTLVIGAGTTHGSGSCSGKAFCIGNGYSKVTLTSPASKLVVVGPTSGSTAGSLFIGSAGPVMSGAFYFPKGPIGMNGGASMSAGVGNCLQIIGSEITLAGGTTGASNCIGGTTSSGTVALIQ